MASEWHQTHHQSPKHMATKVRRTRHHRTTSFQPTRDREQFRSALVSIMMWVCIKFIFRCNNSITDHLKLENIISGSVKMPPLRASHKKASHPPLVHLLLLRKTLW